MKPSPFEVIMNMDLPTVVSYIELAEEFYDIHPSSEMFLLLHTARLQKERLIIQEISVTFPNRKKKDSNVYDPFSPKNGNRL